MDTPIQPAITADPPPDWSTLPDHVPCPLCDYNLRGLVTPRCPECGYSFTWPAFFAARNALHPYLFEHHPHRPAWSFRQTFLRAALPRRFWTTLSAAHTVHPRRLLLYWAVVLTLFVGATAALLALPVSDAIAGIRWDRAKALQQVANRPGFTPQQVAQWYPPVWTRRGIENVFWRINPTLPSVTLFVLAWPWLTAAALMLFQQSMRRSRIRPAQILRCVIYCFDPAAAALLVITAWSVATMNTNTIRFFHPMYLLLGEEMIICLLAGYRLGCAYRRYLTFSHAYATVAAAQIIVLLLGWIAWFRIL
jgi:hypothetical protein